MNTPSEQRRRAGGVFFSPQSVAAALAHWAITSPSDQVLDPSAGDGELLVAAVDRLRELGADEGAEMVVGIEIEAAHAMIAGERLARMGAGASIYCRDAFLWNPGVDENFDAVVANPPWVRYHLFSDARRQLALESAKANGVELNGRASYWAPCLVLTASLLRPAGRLAAVVPAELLQADYAQPVRNFLLERFRSVRLVAFDESLFPNLQVNAMVLLADNHPRAEKGLRLNHLKNVGELARFVDKLADSVVDEAYQAPRWSSLWAGGGIHDQLAQLWKSDCVTTLGEVARIELGIVTGADRFFLLNPRDVARHGIGREYRKPAIGNLRHVLGLEVRRSDWLRIGRQGLPSWVFSGARPINGIRSATVRAYITQGEEQGCNLPLKCRVRHPWYRLSLPVPSDALLTYMVGNFPRLVVNGAGVLTTNRVHRVNFRSKNLTPSLMAASFICSATQLSAEVFGRTYGGGVLKVEPGDARRLLVIVPNGRSAEELGKAFQEVNSMLRSGRTTDAVAKVDEILLEGQLGLSADCAQRIRESVVHLRSLRQRIRTRKAAEER